MRNLLVVLGLGLAFAAGCMAPRAAQFIIPPAHAASGQRWEHFCFEEFDVADVQAKLNQAGAQGWEVAATGQFTNLHIWCMKRPK